MSLHLILARDSRVLVVCGPRQSTAPRLVPRDEPEASAKGPRDETHTRGNPLWWPRARAGTWEVSQEYHVVSILSWQQRQVLCRGMNPKPVPSAPKDDSHSRGHLPRLPRARGGTRQGSQKSHLRRCWHGRSAEGRKPNSCTVGPLDASNPQR